MGPSSQSNSEEYKYQLLSMAAVKIKSSSSPILAEEVEVLVCHLAGVSTCPKTNDFERIINKSGRNLIIDRV
jgi:hypothetical protein